MGVAVGIISLYACIEFSCSVLLYPIYYPGAKCHALGACFGSDLNTVPFLAHPSADAGGYLWPQSCEVALASTQSPISIGPSIGFVRCFASIRV